jgi:hypothetical protein
MRPEVYDTADRPDWIALLDEFRAVALRPASLTH